jgi:hypothetical protein
MMQLERRGRHADEQEETEAEERTRHKKEEAREMQQEMQKKGNFIARAKMDGFLPGDHEQSTDYAR